MSEEWNAVCTSKRAVGQKSGRQGINTAEHFPLDILQEGTERLYLAKMQRSITGISRMAFIQTFCFISSHLQDIPMLFLLGGSSWKLSG